MNSLYLLVEGGETEPALYSAWLPQLLTGSTRLARPEDAQTAYGFYILAGFGYPSLLRRLEDAIADISTFRGFGYLIVTLDCEDRSIDETAREVVDAIKQHNCPVLTEIIVAQCCIESWLLGNRKFVKRNPATDALQAFRNEYDVTQLDPELMPNARASRYNTRAQYHKAYLRAAYTEHGLKFAESKPGPALEPYYLQALIERAAMERTPKHLRTFAAMIATFSKK